MATPNVESFSMGQLASLPRAKLKELVSAGSPIDISFGTDRLRVRFTIVDSAVRIEVLEAEIGDNNVLMNFANGCRNLARQAGIPTIDWLVHASAANERLQGALTSRGFTLQNVSGVGQAYRRSEPIG